MFTGIVEDLGEVKQIGKAGRNSVLEVKAPEAYYAAKAGESIAVNGTCLTLIGIKNKVLAFEVMPETLRATNLGMLRSGYKVNLERSLKLGDRVGGHFVYGHIDCLGLIRRKMFIKDNLCFEISIPGRYLSGISQRGSVAVDGISLTVQDKKSDSFRVYVIPHTYKNTTFGFRRASDKVNIELDKLLSPTL